MRSQPFEFSVTPYYCDPLRLGLPQTPDGFSDISLDLFVSTLSVLFLIRWVLLLCTRVLHVTSCLSLVSAVTRESYVCKWPLRACPLCLYHTWYFTHYRLMFSLRLRHFFTWWSLYRCQLIWLGVKCAATCQPTAYEWIGPSDALAVCGILCFIHWLIQDNLKCGVNIV